jgi:hypothetical protein
VLNCCNKSRFTSAVLTSSGNQPADGTVTGVLEKSSWFHLAFGDGLAGASEALLMAEVESRAILSFGLWHLRPFAGSNVTLS